MRTQGVDQKKKLPVNQKPADSRQGSMQGLFTDAGGLGTARMDVVRRWAYRTMVRPACCRPRKKAASAALNRLTREKKP